MIGNDTGNLAEQLVAVEAIEQIRQTMGFTAGHQYHPFGAGRVMDFPLHLEGGRDRLKRFFQLVQGKRQSSGIDFDTHEKTAGADIGMLVGVGDRAAMTGDEVTDHRYNAHAVRAGKNQTVTAFHMLCSHPVSRSKIGSIILTVATCSRQHCSCHLDYRPVRHLRYTEHLAV
jgi:hypothetical protein